MSKTPHLRRKPGRPTAEAYSVAELSQLLELPEELVRARCRLSFFSGAVELDSGDWSVPVRSVRQALRVTVEPLFSIPTAAGLLDVSYHALFRVTHAVNSLSDPLPEGKRLRAVLLYLGSDEPLKRVPESELRRYIGGWRR